MNRLRVTATEIKQKLVTNRRQLGALRSNDSRLGDVLDNAARRAHVLPASVDPAEDEQDLTDSDWGPVTRMFRFIFDFAKSAKNGFQIIITEHAELDETRKSESHR